MDIYQRWHCICKGVGEYWGISGKYKGWNWGTPIWVMHQLDENSCMEEYIGESGRTFGDRYKEHLKAPSPIHLHTTTTGHPVSPECFSIVKRESHAWSGTSRRPCTFGSMTPQQKSGKIPASTCMGSSTAGHTNTSSKVTLTIPPPCIMSHHLVPLDTTIPPKLIGRGTFFI